jgi:hypothetical protein
MTELEEIYGESLMNQWVEEVVTATVLLTMFF